MIAPARPSAAATRSACSFRGLLARDGWAACGAAATEPPLEGAPDPIVYIALDIGH